MFWERLRENDFVHTHTKIYKYIFLKRKKDEKKKKIWKQN